MHARISSTTAVRRIVMLICAIVTFLPVTSFAMEIEQLWVANANMVMEGSAMTVDLDGDGDMDVITAAYEHLIAVDGTGEILWRFDSRGRYSTYPAILEREDTSPLIYAGDNSGMLSCLNGAGEVVWQVDTDRVFCSGPALADLDGNGSVELIQGDQVGNVIVRDALTGADVWKTVLKGTLSSPAVGDLDGDGSLETIIATGEGKVVALDVAGNVRWEFAFAESSLDWATNSPVIFGNSQGESCVVTGSQGGRLVCLSATGSVIWERTLRGAIASTISINDMNNDGVAEIFVVTQLGVLYRFDERGGLIWDIDTQGRSLASGAIADLDGDSVKEYILATQQGNLLVFNEQGVVEFNHQFDNRTINVTPVVADIVPDRPGLEFAITGGEAGQIFCFGVSSESRASVSSSDWVTYRGDNRLTGSWFGLTGDAGITMTPENLRWDGLLTGTSVQFHIQNPSGRVLRVDASCTGPDGSRQAAVGRVLGRTGVLEMPVAISAPGVYRFDWSLMDDSGARLVEGTRELTLQPYANDRGAAARALLALQAVVESSSSPTRGMSAAMLREAGIIRLEAATLISLQDATTGSSPGFRAEVDRRTTVLNARAERAIALAEVAVAIDVAAPGSRLIPFEGTTWENRDIDRQLPDQLELPLHVERRAVPGEHEPVSIKIFNASLDTLRVSAKAESQRHGPSVVIHEVLPVPTNVGTIAWDPVSPLGSGKVSVPPLETREVWVDIDLTGVSAGSYTVDVLLKAGREKSRVSIDLDVLSFEMAGFGAMRLCGWATYGDEAVADYLAHGGNVFIAGLPPATVSESDPVQIDLDYTDLDEFLARIEGYDVFLLMNGMPSVGVPEDDDSYVSRLRMYLEQLFAHLETRGISSENVALYPHDEPGGHGWNTVNHYVKWAKLGLEAMPELRFYVNGGGDLPMFEALNEVASVWCPGYYMLIDDKPEMNYLRASNKTLWTYDCGYAYARPIGANTKTINVAGQYRMAAPFGHALGATGIGYWSYNIGESMWNQVTHEYPLVYVDDEKRHTSSRRWEAVREGMEDTRIIIKLRESLNDPTVDESVKTKLRHFLDETLEPFARQSITEVQFGLGRYVLDATNSDATVDAFRQEMLDCVKLVSE
jgi:hypothetical protein